MADIDTVLDINERVRRLEARDAIADLIHRYAFNIRRGQPQDCEALFTEDASFSIRDAAGPDATEINQRAHALTSLSVAR